MLDLKLHCSLPFPCPVLVLRAASLNAKAVEELLKCTTFPFCFTVIDNPKLTITVSLTCGNGRSWKTASACCILPGNFFSFMIQCNPSDNLGMLFEIILSEVVLVLVLARAQGRARRKLPIPLALLHILLSMCGTESSKQTALVVPCTDCKFTCHFALSCQDNKEM